MRLLNTETVQLEEFMTLDTLEYAILSHRWESGEISFRDLETKDADLTRKQGYTKIRNACHTAASEGYQYIWIDTCCMDKDSSAELSEAINSMFRWYQTAAVCYAYLSDVRQFPLDVDEFKASSWFTRGWTLQELLAPKRVAFFNRDWALLGWKHDLTGLIVETTGIQEDALIDTAEIFKFAVSERMRWASRRKTTRTEDSAYSLMGMFNVNMPMLYGEGPKAFIRLQEEIVKHSDDQTIFAWSSGAANPGGLLAPSVRCFADIPLLEPLPLSVGGEFQSYRFTNKGLSINLQLRPWNSYIYLARLRCRAPHLFSSTVGIFLYKLVGESRYRRVTPRSLQSDLYIANPIPVPSYFIRTVNVHVPQPDLAVTSAIYNEESLRPSLHFHIADYTARDSQQRLRCDISGNLDFERVVAEYRPNMSMRSPDHHHQAMSGSGRVLCSDLEWLDCDLDTMLLGFDFDFMPVCVVSHRQASHFVDEVTWTSLSKRSVVKKNITNVTCLETSGWSKPFPLSFGKWANSQVNENGLWAMKCDRDINRWRCTVKTSQASNDSQDQALCYLTIKRGSGSQGGWIVKISKNPVWERASNWALHRDGATQGRELRGDDFNLYLD